MLIKKKLVLSFIATVILPMLIICIILSIMISSLSKNNFLNLAKGSLGLVDNAMTILSMTLNKTPSTCVRIPY